MANTLLCGAALATYNRGRFKLGAPVIALNSALTLSLFKSQVGTSIVLGLAVNILSPLVSVFALDERFAPWFALGY